MLACCRRSSPILQPTLVLGDHDPQHSLRSNCAPHCLREGNSSASLSLSTLNPLSEHSLHINSEVLELQEQCLAVLDDSLVDAGSLMQILYAFGSSVIDPYRQ